jgi:hypothetical protein
MVDQVVEQSPQSRLEAMLGDIQEEQQELNLEEPQEVEEEEVEAKAETEEPTDVEEEVEDSEEEEPELEDDVDEEDSEEQPTQNVKIKVNGEEIEKPLDEIVALAQQGLDYTQKTQQVAEQRKELEAIQEQIQAQQIELQQGAQLSGELVEDVAKITSLDQQLAQYQNVDWQKLSDSDVVEAQKLFFQYNQLQQERSNAVSQFEAKRQNALAQQQQIVADKVQKGRDQLAKEIPNWSPETTQEIVSVGKEYGFTDNELNAIIDPRHVRVLHDAMQWRKLKSKNSVTKKKVASAKPVVKPGSKDPKVKSTAASKKMREQLRRTGKAEVASKLIENLI